MHTFTMKKLQGRGKSSKIGGLKSLGFSGLILARRLQGFRGMERETHRTEIAIEELQVPHKIWEKNTWKASKENQEETGGEYIL